jgi:cytochrome c oxidase cbb3-type subunit 1
MILPMNPTDNPRAEQQEIDASAKWPVLVFFGSALVWLLVAGALQLVAAIQLHTPEFLANTPWFKEHMPFFIADSAWFTHGRVAPAAQNALVYGWGFNAAFGFALWLMARLSAATLRTGGWLFVAAKFWNIGLALGLVGILTGASTSYELLEMPRFVTLLLLGSYLLIGVWAITTFSVRNTEHVFASQWYILGAAFWFPWLYFAATHMLIGAPVRGVVQSVVNVWYVNGVYGLWFLPLALAAAYYFLPKILGRPIYDYYIAPVAFWWLSLTTAFAAGSRLIGGPVPAWVATLGTVANFLALAAVVMICVNLFGTLAGRFGTAQKSLTLRFVLLSLFSFLAVVVLNFLLSLRGFAVTAQFTLIPELRDWLLLYGCFSTAMFGAAYFLLPRVTGKGWRSTALIQAHYGATVLSVLAMIIALGIGGWVQGRMLNDAGVQFSSITRALVPWLTLRSLASVTLLVGHAAFFINFVWIAFPVNSRATADATIQNPPEMSVSGAHGTVTEGAH